MGIINLKNVNYEYTISNEDDTIVEKCKALNNINLSIEDGEFVCIIGRNGSGKSTLAKIFNALNIATCGSVEICGYDASKEENAIAIRQNVGMVFQNPDNQLVASIVEEDVAFGLENIGVETNELRKRVDEAIEKLNLTEYKNSSPNKLSGGQKQRVALAGIIAMKTKVIVLDEPTAMLDPKGRKMILDELDKLNKEDKITIILITHYMDEIINADRVLVMSDGEIVLEAKPKEIFSASGMEKYGIIVPKVIDIKNSLIEKGLNIKKDIMIKEELVEAILDEYKS